MPTRPRRAAKEVERGLAGGISLTINLLQMTIEIYYKTKQD
jgi:hypothetical protein